MTIDRTSSERLHASCVAIGGLGVLLSGRSGAGKSDLALRLIDRGATLVADDATLVIRRGQGLVAQGLDASAGRMEVRGLGLVTMVAEPEALVALFVDLDTQGERFPLATATRHLAGVDLPVLKLDPRPASAAIKVELALANIRSAD